MDFLCIDYIPNIYTRVNDAFLKQKQKGYIGSGVSQQSMDKDYCDIDANIQIARNRLGSYCMNECKAYCCRKGHLPLKESEIETVTHQDKTSLLKQGVLKKNENETYSLYMGDYTTPCPSLNTKAFTCSIHSNEKRPKICNDFPIFRHHDMIFISHRCLAVQEQFFYPEIHEWKILGYRVFVSDSLYNSEFYNADYTTTTHPPQPPVPKN
jgi:Fe-S-cluster containining protein